MAQTVEEPKIWRYDFGKITATCGVAEKFCIVFRAVPEQMRGILISSEAVRVEAVNYDDLPKNLYDWRDWQNFRPFTDAPLLVAALQTDGDPLPWHAGFFARESEKTISALFFSPTVKLFRRVE